MQDAELELANPKSIDVKAYEDFTSGHQTFDVHGWVLSDDSLISSTFGSSDKLTTNTIIPDFWKLLFDDSRNLASPTVLRDGESYDKYRIESLGDITRIWNLLDESQNLVIPTALRGGWIVDPFAERTLKLRDAITSPEKRGPSKKSRLSTREAILHKLEDRSPNIQGAIKQIYETISGDRNIFIY